MHTIFSPTRLILARLKPFIFALGWALIASAALSHSARAEDPGAIDLEKSLKVHLPPDIDGVSHDFTVDEAEKIPVLNLRFPDQDLKGAWRAWVDLEITGSAKGYYLLTFQAKSDPSESGIDVRILDKQEKDIKLIAPIKSFTISTEWNEYTLEFSIEEDCAGVATIRWGNLARTGQTISLRQIHLTKE